MAIIRIKRTTGNSLPTGLTFGELAFVQGSGGYTANRLYIANNAGVCVWIGAEILNSPTYWSGATAETTVPTVSAVESRVVAGGGITFASNLNVNIDVGKYFGKYKKGDIIPAQGQTVKWVIEDALSETIQVVVGISFSPTSPSISFGQTASISYTVIPNYTVKTVGATAAGATLEWKRSTDSGWTAYSGTFYSTSTPANTQYVHGGTNGVTLNGTFPLQAYDTRAFQYRFTVHDTAGTSASYTASVTPNSYGADPSFTITVASPNLGTGETNAVREKGNTYSNITATITQKNAYVPLTYWKLQYRENGGAWQDTNKPSANWQAATNPSTSVNTNHTPPTTGLNKVDYQILFTDTYYNQQGTTATSSSTGVSFGYKIFYGATASIPTTSAEIRNLSGICMASGTLAAPNPFILNSGTAYKNFVVALPENLTISDVVDLDLLGGQSILNSYTIDNPQSDINVTDREGGTKAYNIYVKSQGVTYDSNHRHQVTRTGTVS